MNIPTKREYLSKQFLLQMKTNWKKKNTMKLNKKRDELVEEREVKYHRLAAVVHKALDNTPWNL